MPATAPAAPAAPAANPAASTATVTAPTPAPKPAPAPVLPRIGRIVLYKSTISSRMGTAPNLASVPAIIVRAIDENTVDLNVFRAGEHGSLYVPNVTLLGKVANAVDQWFPSNG